MKKIRSLRRRFAPGMLCAGPLLLSLTSCNVDLDDDGWSPVALRESEAYVYSDPVWSPDGKAIGVNLAPLTDSGDGDVVPGSAGFWLVNVDGTAKRRELPFPLPNVDWSSDGRWIVFECEEGLSRVEVVNGHPKPESREVLPAPRGSSDPTFNPGGSEVIYLTNRTSASRGLFRLSLLAGRLNRIGEPNLSAPDWSPDGNLIVHEIVIPQRSGPSTRGLGVVDAAGDHLRILTTDAGYGPKWSPDGRTVAFAARPDESRSALDLFLVNGDGTGLRRLTFAGADENFDWSPDGRRIVYAKAGAEMFTGNGLWIVEVETGEEYPLAGPGH